MKILLIDNNTQHLDSLRKALKGHQLKIQKYQPGLNFDQAGKDLVVLSGGGGEGLEIHDAYKKGQLWYEDEMRFVRDSSLPIIGICMGFEVICRLFGSDIHESPELIQGFKELDASIKGRQTFSRSKLKQFESHNWCVPAVNTEEFDILAASSTGIEMIKHKKRSIIASQFHPEVEGGSLKLERVLELL